MSLRPQPPLEIAIYSYQFLAMAAFYRDSIHQLNELPAESQAMMPNYYWTINSHIAKFDDSKVQTWKSRNPRKERKYKITIDLALAYIYNIDDYPNFIFPHQELKDKLIHALINRGFQMEQFKPATYELA